MNTIRFIISVVLALVNFFAMFRRDEFVNSKNGDYYGFFISSD